MTIEEIFQKLSAHMKVGLILHDHIANAFSFLNLQGYSKDHEQHFFEESKNYRHLQNYYLGHYHKLIADNPIEKSQVIPISWYKYTRMDVDINTKRTAIKDLIKKWVDWEKETKDLLETSYKELYELGEIAAAIEIQTFICDVDDELRQAQELQINLESMNYDMPQIIAEQSNIRG